MTRMGIGAGSSSVQRECVGQGVSWGTGAAHRWDTHPPQCYDKLGWHRRVLSQQSGVSVAVLGWEGGSHSLPVPGVWMRCSEVFAFLQDGEWWGWLFLD